MNQTSDLRLRTCDSCSQDIAVRALRSPRSPGTAAVLPPALRTLVALDGGEIAVCGSCLPLLRAGDAQRLRDDVRTRHAAAGLRGRGAARTAWSMYSRSMVRQRILNVAAHRLDADPAACAASFAPAWHAWFDLVRSHPFFVLDFQLSFAWGGAWVAPDDERLVLYDVAPADDEPEALERILATLQRAAQRRGAEVGVDRDVPELVPVRGVTELLERYGFR